MLTDLLTLNNLGTRCTSKKTDSLINEGGKGGLWIKFDSIEKKQFHNSRVLKKAASRLSNITVCFTDLYHVSLDRLELISLICVIFQYVSTSARPPNNGA